MALCGWKQAPDVPAEVSPVILLSGRLEPWILVLYTAPGAKVWIFPQLSGTSVCHRPECSVGEGRLWGPLTGAADLNSECNRV